MTQPQDGSGAIAHAETINTNTENLIAETATRASAFAALGLDDRIVRALGEVNYTTPTPVQAQAIPACLSGRDLLVTSQTGSGKTAAFILPAIQRISEQPEPQRPRMDGPPQRMKGRRPRPAPAKPSLLVLTPTRELALQVTTATAQYGRHLRRIVCASILGGMPYPKQLDMLARMPDIIIATPGRLLDHIDSGRIDLSALDMLVFDEADRMLDMGFSDDIEAIVGATPATRQMLMFSATMDRRIEQLAERMMREPQRIEIAAAKVDQSNIEERLHFTDDMSHKQQLLDHLLRDASLKQAIVFTATKRDADSLAERLTEHGFSAGALHGDMHQGARNRTLTALRRGQLRVLVATDVAARGIDVPDITHVVNFDLPKQAEDYVHRIGRTGRAGRSGIAINLVNHNDTFQWRRIERFVDRRIDASVVEGLEPKRSAKPRTGGPRAGGDRGGYRGNGGNGGGYRGQREGYGARQGGNGGNSGNNEGRFQRSFAGDRDGFAPRRDDRNGNSNSNSGGYQGAQREWNRDDRAPRPSYGQGQQNRGDWQQRPARTQGTQDGNRGYGNSAGTGNGGGYGNRDGNREGAAPRRFGDNNSGNRFGDAGNGAQRRSYGNRDGNRDSYGSKGRSRDFDR
ncbi:MAG: DEAD/DEAH box helicase [Ralstonia sp.]|jgi:superfamily II DNA/RNA helicase|uniref:ATP-dependent RNA helicase RhlE n=3 Tax=Ralstonia pickettii TaxID=329 RepID=A0A2P4RJ02_RALPI|nr:MULTISPECIES: DEAD/DEAH box helicase [Ralstonia]MBA4202542.1 RNA helicase [Ralstonia sp.]MBA4230267.1 RNA helicase [Ralstonia sp.]MBA4235997.1 RNA helicase [Ralstonia sp.]MBA4280001.1 RNA helicase [Ralstonia sp.]MBA4296028.1 RNA helicase [Ralstonia sp.]